MKIAQMFVLKKLSSFHNHHQQSTNEKSNLDVHFYIFIFFVNLINVGVSGPVFVFNVISGEKFILMENVQPTIDKQS